MPAHLFARDGRPLEVNKIYSQIQQANADQLKPIEQILAAADTNWDAIAAAAQKQSDSAPTA